MNSQISPRRKLAFLDFISSLPRKCSPTIGGLLSDCGSKELSPNVSTPKQWSSSTFTSPNQPKSPTTFQWTIDDFAELYGKDFDNTHELEEFHQFESESELSNHLELENKQFFSQSSIIPSPVMFRNSETVSSSSVLIKNIPEHSFLDSTIDKLQNSADFRYTGSFIRYLDSVETYQISVNEVSSIVDDCLQQHSTNYGYNEENDKTAFFTDSDLDSFVDYSELSNCPPPTTSTNLSILSSIDSDFVSGIASEPMEISQIGTTAELSIVNQPSTPSMFNHPEYFNLSPVSPFTCRYPSSNIFNQPTSEFSTFSNISPIVPSKNDINRNIFPFEMNKENIVPVSRTNDQSLDQCNELRMSIDMSPINSGMRSIDINNEQSMQTVKKKVTKFAGNDHQFKTPIGRPRARRRGKVLFNEATSTPNT